MMKNFICFFVLVITLPMLGCHSNTPLENDRQGGDGILGLIANEPGALDPAQVEAMISGSFLTWWQATMASVPAMGLAMTSDTYTCSWGNFGMRELSEEPRTAFQNDPNYSRIDHIEVPWSGNYSAIFEANDGIRAIQSGTVSLGADSARAVGFGKLVQGLAHGYIALFFDQGFVFNDTTNFRTTTLTLAPYTAVMAAAIQQLQDAIQIFNANTFTIPNDWINGQTYTNVELAEIAHSFIARYMVSVARDRTERQNVENQ